MASDATRHLDHWQARNQLIAESLVIPFAVVMLDEFRHGSPEMPLADRNQPIKAFFFDRSHEPFGVRVRIGRALGSEDDADPRVPGIDAYVAAPLPISIAD